MSSIMTHIDDNVSKVPMPHDSDVLEAMHAVVHAFRSKLLRVEADQPRDLSPMEGKALGYFARYPGATQSDLATHAGRDRGQVARLIGGLKEKGLLLAVPDETDRRVWRLSLSEEAQAMHQLVQQRQQVLVSVATQGMSDREVQQLMGLVRRVRENLERLD